MLNLEAISYVKVEKQSSTTSKGLKTSHFNVKGKNSVFNSHISYLRHDYLISKALLEGDNMHQWNTWDWKLIWQPQQLWVDMHKSHLISRGRISQLSSLYSASQFFLPHLQRCSPALWGGRLSTYNRNPHLFSALWTVMWILISHYPQ